ncbi:hypothetical protein [Geopsychrobacter electrodiphilus]|uniref:hypothetical protein n=1 Tax=Geopsychrobacter electrodiphilus TaxID=225196 RepID=UPI0003748CFB|nr:hypothetical protein [Geopsychrobacter electrodiphilus]
MSRLYSFVLLLFLCACGGGGGNSSDIGPGGSNPDLSDVSPYTQASPYLNVLKDCATAAHLTSLCSMETLPLVGQELPAPTVADLMGRVLVSHPWMGERLELVLNQLPPDLLTLFKGVTAIVIDADIRPSFYSPNTAAIYLDPANLWLTNEEKATITKNADFRQDFGSELQFVTLWRYVKSDAYAYNFYPLDGTETRQLDDIIYPFSRVLYHELAHANDFLPPATQTILDRHLTPYAASVAIENQSLPGHLNSITVLSAQLFLDLAKVLFLGVPASAEQQSLSAAQLGPDFAVDVANDIYGYSTKHEDIAMLFEEVMMKYHFDLDRDIAFTDRPLTPEPACDDYSVQWGVRNRLGEPRVRLRAEQVVANLLPDTDLSAFFSSVPSPTQMTNNQGWCQNLSLSTLVPQGVSAAALPISAPSADQFKGDLLVP